MLLRARSALPGMAIAVLLASPGVACAEPLPSARTQMVDNQGFSSEPRKLATPPSRRPTRTAARPAAARPAADQPIAVSRPAAADVMEADRRVWRQTGIASWYGGSRWQGKLTASGTRYDENKLTAAHATLPIGTKVRVTLEGSDRSVIVVINDRPGTRRRIIDLSRQAAAELGILVQGIAVVNLAAL